MIQKVNFQKLVFFKCRCYECMFQDINKKKNVNHDISQTFDICAHIEMKKFQFG